MKIFEVAIQKIRKPNRTDFVWPEWWGDVVGSVDVVAYEDEGKVREGAICVCSNSTWESILLKHDKSITARTVTEANIKGRK